VCQYQPYRHQPRRYAFFSTLLLSQIPSPSTPQQRDGHHMANHRMTGATVPQATSANPPIHTNVELTFLNIFFIFSIYIFSFVFSGLLVTRQLYYPLHLPPCLCHEDPPPQRMYVILFSLFLLFFSQHPLSSTTQGGAQHGRHKQAPPCAPCLTHPSPSITTPTHLSGHHTRMPDGSDTQPPPHLPHPTRPTLDHYHARHARHVRHHDPSAAMCATPKCHHVDTPDTPEATTPACPTRPTPRAPCPTHPTHPTRPEHCHMHHTHTQCHHAATPVSPAPRAPCPTHPT